MSNLNASQLMELAAGAGFAGANLPVAVAIALAESGGDPHAYNPETAAGNPAGKGSFGLWQINLNAHPEFSGANLFDPQTNAAAAYSIYARKGSFQPWATYSSKKYQAYLNSVPLVLDASTGLPVTDSAPTIDEPGAVPMEAAVLAGPNYALWMLFGAGALLLWLWES